MSGPVFQVIALAHLAVTLFMVGVIWFVQVVHYPLMAGQTPEYAREHQRRTGWVLGPVMLVELGTAVTLAGIAPTWASVGGLVLLAAVWASTWGVQVPCHRKLLNKPDPTALHRLVTTNWVRTALWTTRGGLAVVLIL